MTDQEIELLLNQALKDMFYSVAAPAGKERIQTRKRQHQPYGDARAGDRPG